MKKVILSALLAGLLFSSGTLLAQISYGPKLALNVATVHDKANDPSYDSGNIKSKIGFQAGGMMNAQINDYFSIRPELVFSNVGAKTTTPYGSSTISYNYISLPINFVGHLPINDNFKLQAFAGPYAALCVGGKFNAEASYFGYSTSIKGNIKPKKDPGTDADNIYLNPWDFGLNFGLGFQAKAFVFSASYAIGFSNLEPHYSNSQDESIRGDAGTSKNRNLSFGVAYLFGGK